MNFASAAAQVVYWNGKLQELWQPIKAEEILTQDPNFFLCSSETMNLNSVPCQMAKDEELQLGQLYFLIPVSKLHLPFSLQDLCKLAISASKALNDSDMGFTSDVELSTHFACKFQKRLSPINLASSTFDIFDPL
ncbi:hypothetical protein ACH5RR_022118 [Cinchona calisaya]|uniref:Uncharacterized protein n=1 Tax=Cinchona calisaya TaxID=153742 RepID=A0ABD2Z8S3_9GENT